MFIEKHGGLWAGGESAVFEQFDATLQRLGVVCERAGLFTATIYERRADPQWRRSVWSELRPGSLFDSRVEAIDHVRSCLSPDASA